jgi:type III secretion system YscD/HrpQ family protein
MFSVYFRWGVCNPLTQSSLHFSLPIFRRRESRLINLSLKMSMFSPIPKTLDIELRVLHGPQAGAALPLTDEEIVIGSDGQCDVILQSPTIAACHARLAVTASEFTLYALDGEIVASEGAATLPPWQLGTTIYLGDVGITIDHIGADWAAAPPRQIVMNEGAAIEPSPRWSMVLQRHWKTATLILAMLIGMSIAVQWTQFTRVKTAATHKLSSTNLEAINALIARYSHGVPLTLDTDAATATVRGFLPNANQVSALKRDLSRWREDLNVDVQSEDTLLAASRNFLAQEHSTLKVAIVNGYARLSGFGNEKKEVMRLAQDMKKNVTGLAGVDAMFVEREQLEAWLRAWRRETLGGGQIQNPPPETLFVENTPAGNLELHGTLTSSLMTRLRDALTHRSLQKNMLLALRIAITSDLTSQHPPTVQAFSAGAVPYVFLSNGRRVMMGGAVDGFQLIAINQKGPVFVKQGG